MATLKFTKIEAGHYQAIDNGKVIDLIKKSWGWNLHIDWNAIDCFHTKAAAKAYYMKTRNN